MLKELRINAGLTQKELAKGLGYSSPQFVSNWERGVSNLPVGKIKQASKLLRIPMVVLVSLTEVNYKKRLMRRIGGLK